LTSSITGSYVYTPVFQSSGRRYAAVDTDFIEQIIITKDLTYGFIPLSLKIYDRPI